MNNFYQELDYLAFGSRLRRLSEGFISEINLAYKQKGIAFDASWFPVFYLLDREEEISIRGISDQAGVSHSAVSQLVSLLYDRELIQYTVSGEDGRKKMVSFTALGKELLHKVKPVWEALDAAMRELPEGKSILKHLLPVVSGLEAALREQPLSERILVQFSSQKKNN